MQQYSIREKSGTDLVFNIQHYSLHDGSGIRTIVFLKGCPLRCRWCCNPESQNPNREIFYLPDKCISQKECGLCASVCPESAISFADPSSKASIRFSSCSNCLKCAGVCPSKAIVVQGESYSVKELVDLAERDSIFYQSGNGGLTVSGGEPLSHIDFLEALLTEAQNRYINTAIETCGCAPYDSLRRAAKHLDQILFDIKSMNAEKHREYTGQSNQQIIENFTRLCEEFPNLPKKVRTPVIPGFNDTPEEIEAIRTFLRGKPNVTYEPLRYHSFGKGKYAALGREYPMGDVALSEEKFYELTGL
ncbi:MAG: glycyl-radical enzyme activating protein [Butyricicoccus sp.]